MRSMRLILSVAFVVFALYGRCMTAFGQDWLECNVWTDVIGRMEREDSLNVTCYHNYLCTGFDCYGVYQLPMLQSYQSSQMHFGMEFLPCQDPVKLRVQISLLNTSNEKQISLTHSQQSVNFPVTGLPPMIQRYINATLQVHVGYVSQRNISLEMSVMVTGSFIDHSFGRTYELLPETYIRVPECSYLSPTPTSRVSESTVKPQTTPSPNATLTGAKCSVEKPVYGQCGNQQLCDKGWCRCVHGMVYDRESTSGSCQCPQGSVWNATLHKCLEDIRTTVSPSALPAAGQSTSTLIIVLVVCLLAGFVFAIIVTGMIIKYRRHRERYGQHEPLINNEGDDRDLEADPPMLQG